MKLLQISRNMKNTHKCTECLVYRAHLILVSYKNSLYTTQNGIKLVTYIGEIYIGEINKNTNTIPDNAHIVELILKHN